MNTPAIADPEKPTLAALRQAVDAMPIDQINVSDPQLFRDDSIGVYFERLRREAPVHYCRESRFGPYWSITRFADIREVELAPDVFSSDASLGGIALFEPIPEERFPSFIAMDPPRHDEQRKTVAPIASPPSLARLETLARERAAGILDGLPIGEPFDWVERVSIELTTQMLATLFDFPFEDRRLLTWWSEMATGSPGQKGPVTSWEMRREELDKCLAYFTRLWHERAAAPPSHDLLSMMAHSPVTKDLPPGAFLGNLILLIVGGNDTTRNSITGGLLALHRHPQQYAKLRADPSLVRSLAHEIIRWQTPLAHMRRTATTDATLGGQTIRRGDRVALWYLSANRDETAIPDADKFLIDRREPKHLSFGFGIHHCMGSRIALLQLRVLWEEILERFPLIEVLDEVPPRTFSNFVHGFLSMRVKIPSGT